MTERVATETTLLPMAHLTAVNHSVAELRNVIGRLAGAGIRNMLAVRGDPPGDPMGEWVQHPEGVLYAEDLVRLVTRVGRLLRRRGRVPVQAPALARHRVATPRYFVRKCRAGADFAITQMFFDADDYLRLRDRVAAAGCDTPIVPGVMPVTTMAHDRAVRAALRRAVPAGAAGRAVRAGRRRPGGGARARHRAVPARCAQRLLDEGVPGIHFITLNRSTATREVWQNLRVAARSDAAWRPTEPRDAGTEYASAWAGAARRLRPAPRVAAGPRLAAAGVPDRPAAGPRSGVARRR